MDVDRWGELDQAVRRILCVEEPSKGPDQTCKKLQGERG